MLTLPSAVEDCWHTQGLMLGRREPFVGHSRRRFSVPYPGHCILTARWCNPAQTSSLEKWKCGSDETSHEYFRGFIWNS